MVHNDAIFSKVVKPHEFAYDSVESHTAMYVMKSSTKNAEFLSMLYPFTSQTLQTTTLHSPLLTALKINDDSYTDIVFHSLDGNIMVVTKDGILFIYRSGHTVQWIVEGDIVSYSDT